MQDDIECRHIDHRQLQQHRSSTAPRPASDDCSSTRLQSSDTRIPGQRVEQLGKGQYTGTPPSASKRDPAQSPRPGLRSTARRCQPTQDVLPHAVRENTFIRRARRASHAACLLPVRCERQAGGRPSVTRLIHRMWISGSGIGRPRNGGARTMSRSARVRAHRVLHELADIVEDAPSVRTAWTMVAKLSSSSTMSAASRATSVPCRP